MRVLAVDPSQTISEHLAKGLSREGFLLDQVTNAKKALWMAKTTPYDVILLSIPEIKVLSETVKRLVEDSSSAFFIALMPYTDLEKRMQLFEQGLDDVIMYPCSFRELLIKIRSLLRREKSPVARTSVFELDSLAIEPEKFLVTRGSREILLRRKEFDLLYFFFRNQGRVLSKMNILEGVWDSNADILTNTLEVHILNLRRKIDAGLPDQRRLIHTVYGRGYLFGLRSSVGLPAGEAGATPTTVPPPTN